MRRALALGSLFAVAMGCAEQEWTLIETPTGSYPVTRSGAVVRSDVPDDPAYGRIVDRVVGMVADDGLGAAAQSRGLDLVNVMWEDTGRAQGSALGPNISDLTLQVRRRDRGHFADSLLPVIRHPNFTDHTGDVPADRFFVRVGNERGSELFTVALTELLGDLRRFASSPRTLAPDDAKAVSVLAARDTHFLVSAQAVFLPISRAGKAVFNPVLFNYQSAPESPAVLAILATREGTSMTVIENRRDDLTFKGWGQEMYFNEAGQRADFTAERRSHVAARIAAQGGPRTEADRSALGRGADVLALIQVPLVHAQRGVLGGIMPSSGGGSGSGKGKDSGYGYEFSDDPLAAGGFGPNDATIRVRPGPMRTDLERAVLGHGPRLGPYVEGYGSRLERDERFPIRITVQFYKATSDGAVSDKDLDAIARSIGSVYEHAEFVGSLVVPEGDARRPTAWQRIPNEWFPW